jgi:ribonuclease D
VTGGPGPVLAGPRGGIPPLADTRAAVERAAASLADGTGPIAVDTERASGFRFDDRAWLVQLRRRGSGTHLIDPATVPQAGPLLAPVMGAAPWILHAAHTDLPALTSLGWSTPRLHDTQIAGRLLGLGQVGLAGMLDRFLGVTVAKNKGREDWSARPLSTDMLTYAALDVELLPELLEDAHARLGALGRAGWYREECDHILESWSHPVPEPDWTGLRGLGAVRDPRGLEVARQLTLVRTAAARHRDVPPEKVLRSSAIVDAARSPGRAAAIVAGGLRGRSGAGSGRLRRALSDAVAEALSTSPDNLPPRPRTHQGHPDHRNWPRDHPRAARLLDGYRRAVDDLAAGLGLQPPELIVARSLRSVAWDSSVSLPGGPEGSADPVGDLEELIGDLLDRQGARRWQEDLLSGVLLPVLAEEAAGGGDR